MFPASGLSVEQQWFFLMSASSKTNSIFLRQLENVSRMIAAVSEHPLDSTLGETIPFASASLGYPGPHFQINHFLRDSQFKGWQQIIEEVRTTLFFFRLHVPSNLE